MRLFFFGLILVVIVVFTLQNQQPTTVIILNQALPLKLPLSWWVLLSVAAGLITSLILQFLNQLASGFNKNNNRFSSPEPEPFEPSPRRESYQEIPKSEEILDVKARKTLDNPENYEKEDEDWNIEEPPAYTPERVESEWAAKQRQEEREEPPFQPPPRTSAIYSYRYRDSQKSKPKSDQGVYDADYRIISPPYRDSSSENNDDDEDWI